MSTAKLTDLNLKELKECAEKLQTQNIHNERILKDVSHLILIKSMNNKK